jgi:hypothetical protein
MRGGALDAARRAAAAAALLACVVMARSPAQAQERRNEQHYYPGAFNWSFLSGYPDAARLFNAFDYGHAVLYEVLYTRGGADQDRRLDAEYRYLTTDLLRRPPRFAIPEEAVMPHYAKLAWRAKEMFDWAHTLHRQIYDVYADERIADSAKDALIERVTDHYLSRRGYAFAPVPKAMALMDEQYFSQSFRRRHPRFNGLIWAYHWLQVGLYEPFTVYRSPQERRRGIERTVARFWAMLDDPPGTMPAVMPMTAAVAPEFSRRHPRAAAIFDNLHMMHDIISDILESDSVPRARKRAEIYRQLDELARGDRNTMSWDEWRMMGDMMGGVERMGGTPIPADAPAPTASPDSTGHAGHHPPIPRP